MPSVLRRASFWGIVAIVIGVAATGVLFTLGPRKPPPYTPVTMVDESVTSTPSLRSTSPGTTPTETSERSGTGTAPRTTASVTSRRPRATSSSKASADVAERATGDPRVRATPTAAATATTTAG